jgi:hypothetical protein
LEVEIAVIDAAQLDGKGDSGQVGRDCGEPRHAEDHRRFWPDLRIFSGFTLVGFIGRMYW